jgi:hypothetical protein
MTIYTVHAPIDLQAGSVETAERLLFVKEGFCWPALIVPLFWLLFRRMWIVLAIFVALLIGVELVRRMTGLAGVSLLIVLLALFLGVVGNDLRRWTLARRGYFLIDVVEAGSRDEAEIRYFHLDQPPLPTEPVAAIPAPQPVFVQPAAGGDIIGLFPTAGTVR